MIFHAGTMLARCWHDVGTGGWKMLPQAIKTSPVEACECSHLVNDSPVDSCTKPPRRSSHQSLFSNSVFDRKSGNTPTRRLGHVCRQGITQKKMDEYKKHQDYQVIPFLCQKNKLHAVSAVSSPSIQPMRVNLSELA